MNHRGEGGIQGRMLLPDRARLEKQSFLLLVAGIGVSVTPGLPEGLGFPGQGAGPLRLRHGDSVSCGLGLVVTWAPCVLVSGAGCDMLEGQGPCARRQTHMQYHQGTGRSVRSSFPEG